MVLLPHPTLLLIIFLKLYQVLFIQEERMLLGKGKKMIKKNIYKYSRYEKYFPIIN